MHSPESLKDHYEECFIKHGDNYLGADWTKEKDLYTRYDVMLSIIDKSISEKKVLDFGCGTGMLYNYILSKDINYINYSGIDINDILIEKAKTKFKNINFKTSDIFKNPESLEQYDYIICNGVFTEKINLTHEQMFNFFSSVLNVLFKKTNIGISFNLMSKHVDYEREDLFHVSHDELASFLTKNLSRNYIIRNDYGLYEYTTYLYK